MATLSSPGVSVTVIDESFYTPSAPGTVPLIIVASQQDKANSSGTGTAPGTLKANAGKVYLLTSQMDLGTTFGIPYFQTDANNNPVHAGEVNEYGLQAAYSFLGVSNRAYVVRADLDTKQLEASANEPSGAPADGTVWLDTASTNWGIFEWNGDSANIAGGQSFTVTEPTIITDTTRVADFQGEDYAPLASYGAIGDYAIVAVTNLYKLWYKKAQTHTAPGWVEVGSEAWVASRPTLVGAAGAYAESGHTITLNSMLVTNSGITQATMATAIGTAAITGITAAVVNGYLEIYSTGVPVVVGTVGTGLVEAGLTTGTFNAPALTIAPHTSVPQYKMAGDDRPSGSIWVKTTTPNQGASYSVKVYNVATGMWVEQTAPVFASPQAALLALDPTGGGVNIARGATYVKYNDSEASPVAATFKLYARSAVGQTVIRSVAIGADTLTGSISFTIQESLKDGTLGTARTISFTAAGLSSDATTMAGAINAAGFTYVVASTVSPTGSTKQLIITHTAGGEIKFVDVAMTIGSIFTTSDANHFYMDPSSTGSDGKYVGTMWTATSGGTALATASSDAPMAAPLDGQLWYTNVIDQVDIMVHDGNTWVGYRTATAYPDTDVTGPQVRALAPKTQDNGDMLVDGDIWVSTADLENYPMVYRYNGTKWVLLDNSDQTTENGVLFHDARWNTDGMTVSPASIADLTLSSFLDFDAPDPALYPQGMLLWNLRRSGNNVLRYVENYVDVNERNIRMDDAFQTDYVVDKWVSEAPNATNGAGQFGRKAQRAVVLQSLNALINGNQQIRDEDSRVFNIMACPGYLEVTPVLNALNGDRGLLSFIIADAPARLAPDATSLSNWGNNVAGATGDGEVGLVSTDPYSAVYYPWGFTTDLLGNNIAVPPSHIMLRTIALSDNVSYEWFAPAGTRRGGVTNASSVGYITAEGEFQTVALNNGQRDTLAGINVNPITYIGGIGLVVYGQKTRQLVASSLDRINVARLVIHLRYQLNQIAKPYIFEPNDTITRNEIKQQVESLMLELTGQRALYDYLVVCDTSNNTPSRIDRNELHVDIAIEPVKAVEFIYIPLRLENTGAIKGLGA